jgi:hypothetical protein
MQIGHQALDAVNGCELAPPRSLHRLNRRLPVLLSLLPVLISPRSLSISAMRSMRSSATDSSGNDSGNDAIFLDQFDLGGGIHHHVFAPLPYSSSVMGGRRKHCKLQFMSAGLTRACAVDDLQLSTSYPVHPQPWIA